MTGGTSAEYATICNTLDSFPVKDVLSRLYTEALENDTARQAEDRAILAVKDTAIDDQMLPVIFDRYFMEMAPEVGRLIYLLIRSHRPALVVEFGTSYGLSTIHIAAALRDNGTGRLITTERNATKAARAAQHLEQVGLSDLVEIRLGDAFQTLNGVEAIDVLLLDGWKPLYLPLLKQLEAALSSGSLIIADDVISRASKLTSYLSYVREASNGYLSLEIPLDDGVELSIRSISPP